MNDKQQMLQARELIRQKRYDDARAILSKIKHPTAEKWLAKLDEIAPAPKQKNGCVRNAMTTIVGVVGGLVILFGIIWVIGYPQRERVSAKFEWRWFCESITRDAVVNAQVYDGVDYADGYVRAFMDACERQAEHHAKFNMDELLYCYRTTNQGDLEQQYIRCADENDIFVDGTLIALALQPFRR